MPEPRELTAKLEQVAALPSGTEERFRGYGVMGLPFASGHVLGLRRFPASSVGPGYTSVWHRNPEGSWTFYTDVDPLQSCNRYMGNAVDRVEQAEISIEWSTSRIIDIKVPAAQLTWHVEVAPTPVTRALNAFGRVLPDRLWRNDRVLDVMGRVAGRSLRLGRVELHGTVPNGQRFIANPRLMWSVTSSNAQLGDEDLGPPGPIDPQAHLGDFWIPQRGIFMIGMAFFEPFEEGRHLAVASRAG